MLTDVLTFKFMQTELDIFPTSLGVSLNENTQGITLFLNEGICYNAVIMQI